MTASWRDTLARLGISTSPTGAPPGEEGDWSQLFAVFGTSGFLRLLTDGTKLFVELAPPRGAVGAAALLQSAGWTLVEEGPPSSATRPFPPDEDALRALWIAASHWGEAIRNDDATGFEAAMASPPQPSADVEDAAPGGASPFESIGEAPLATSRSEVEEDTRPALADGAFAYALEVEKDWVDVVVGVSAVLDPEEFEALERILIRNLRAKFDVSVRPVAAHEIGTKLAARPETKLGFRVSPDAVVGAADVAGARLAVDDYFGNIESLAKSGIDPLVFLGVRTSARLNKRGPATSFEPIGTDEPDESAAATRSELLIDDSEPSPRRDDNATEVVLQAPYEPDDGDPLEPGRFEDPRLREQDASTALVDVVLRHPGFSDRRIGQVLSILLSEEYANCLQLAARAPVVITWGVARERAQTMKTVIEGAGGKVFLAEPGRFGEE